MKYATTTFLFVFALGLSSAVVGCASGDPGGSGGGHDSGTYPHIDSGTVFPGVDSGPPPTYDAGHDSGTIVGFDAGHDSGMCVPSCTTDSDCLASCPAYAGSVACCDTATNTCYNYSASMCPASTTSDGGMSSY